MKALQSCPYSRSTWIQLMVVWLIGLTKYKSSFINDAIIWWMDCEGERKVEVYKSWRWKGLAIEGREQIIHQWKRNKARISFNLKFDFDIIPKMIITKFKSKRVITITRICFIMSIISVNDNFVHMLWSFRSPTFFYLKIFNWISTLKHFKV